MTSSLAFCVYFSYKHQIIKLNNILYVVDEMEYPIHTYWRKLVDRVEAVFAYLIIDYGTKTAECFGCPLAASSMDS